MYKVQSLSDSTITSIQRKFRQTQSVLREHKKISYLRTFILTDTDRAEWAIDNIIIAVQDSSMLGFQEDFDPMQSTIWYMAQNAVPKVACKSADNALEFSKNAGFTWLLCLQDDNA